VYSLNEHITCKILTATPAKGALTMDKSSISASSRAFLQGSAVVVEKN